MWFEAVSKVLENRLCDLSSVDICTLKDRPAIFHTFRCVDLCVRSEEVLVLKSAALSFALRNHVYGNILHILLCRDAPMLKKRATPFSA